MRSLASWVAILAVAAGCAGEPPGGPGGPGGKADDLVEGPDAGLDAAAEADAGDAADAGRPAGPPAARRRFAEAWTCPPEGALVPVAFFDADSTLRISKSGAVSANAVDDVNVLPFAAARIAELNASGVLVAVVSNQGGVAAGILPIEVAEGALVFTADRLAELGGRIDYLDFAEARDDFRKPEIGMALLLDDLLLERCGAGIDLERSVMVGDSGFKEGVDGPHPDGRPADDFSNSDRRFAENLGVPFHEPTDYFGWRDFGVFNLAAEAELVDLLDAIEATADALASRGGDPERAAALRAEVDGNRAVNGLD